MKGERNSGKNAPFGNRFMLPELAQNAPSGLSMIDSVKSPKNNQVFITNKKSLKAVESLNQ